MLQATLLVYTLGCTVEVPVMTPYRCTGCLLLGLMLLLLGLGLLTALLLVCVKLLLEAYLRAWQVSGMDIRGRGTCIRQTE